MGTLAIPRMLRVKASKFDLSSVKWRGSTTYINTEGTCDISPCGIGTTPITGKHFFAWLKATDRKAPKTLENFDNETYANKPLPLIPKELVAPYCEDLGKQQSSLFFTIPSPELLASIANSTLPLTHLDFEQYVQNEDGRLYHFQLARRGERSISISSPTVSLETNYSDVQDQRKAFLRLAAFKTWDG